MVSLEIKKQKKTKLESIVNQKKAYELFSDKKELEENDYDSEKDESYLVKFDEELSFKKDVKGVDLVFLLDSTGSMNPYFKSCKFFIRKVIRDALRCITQYKFEDEDLLRLALVCYRDHSPQGKSVGNFVVDFTHEHETFKEVLKSINAKGGGDKPEAVFDGLNEVVNSLTWREDSEKKLFHFLDAPPHGKEYIQESDGFPDGCPCNNSLEDTLIPLREMNVDYTIIKLDECLDKMITKFSEIIKVDVLTLELEKDNSKSVDQSN